MNIQNELERNDIVIDPDFSIDNDSSSIMAYVETWFDVDLKFGLNTKDNDTSVNLYAEYYPETGELKIKYQVSSDKGSELYEYAPTKGERILLLGMMADACRTAHGCSLDGYFNRYAQEMEEGVMQL